jgi:hypothetical protein
LTADCTDANQPIHKTCHAERSEASSCTPAGKRTTGFFAALRMTTAGILSVSIRVIRG